MLNSFSALSRLVIGEPRTCLWGVSAQTSDGYFLPAFAFAHLARCAAAIFLRDAADTVRLGVAVPGWPLDFLFAHRAFCARLIRLRAAADMADRVRWLLGFAVLVVPATPVRALMAASRRPRSARSCWMICSIGMAGIVAPRYFYFFNATFCSSNRMPIIQVFYVWFWRN
jgi:hypothetical protein